MPEVSQSPGTSPSTTLGPPEHAHPPRLIAFYLPQYHPIPENDRWWGKGFTEWTNVTNARPLFKGHYQPHLPSDLGFYDLRLPEARAAQAEMAREFGIHGFCYYHYWFNGRRILERPFHEVLASGEPSLPFCLCWANENWTRRWDGGESELLLQQEYTPEDDLAHIRSLMPAFADPRYIRVDDRPLFIVYRAALLPDPAATTKRWREAARAEGIGELFLGLVDPPGEQAPEDPRTVGFDAMVGFMPHPRHVGPLLRRGRRWSWPRKLGLTEPAFARHSIYSYDEMAEKGMNRPYPDFEYFPCVTPQWDNSSRRATRGHGANIFHGSTPQVYQAWLERTLDQVAAKPPERRIVFINAWNEWAEGNHLEPDRRWGTAYLEATRKAIDSSLKKRAGK